MRGNGAPPGRNLSEPQTYGMAFRLRLPYRRPKLLDVRLNGHRLPESPTDGYQAWYADGFTQVQVNVPPAKTKSLRLAVVTCAYAPDVKRTYGWTPPREVLDRLKTNKGK